MKNILLILLCCALVFRLTAQEVWQVPGYLQNAEILMAGNGNEVKVSMGDITALYPVHKSGSAFKLKNVADNQKILDMLKVDAAAVNSRYTDLPEELLPAEKLITKAAMQTGKKLMIVSGADPVDADSTGNGIDGENETAGGIDSSQADAGENTGMHIGWGYMAVAGLILIVVTAGITRYLSRSAQDKMTATTEGPTVPATGTPTTKSADSKTLKQQLVVLQQQCRELEAARAETEKQLMALQTFDKSYFNEAFRKLVVPMSAAIENGTQTEIVENMMKMAAHFTSLTRYKIAKKQNYDEANIRYMLQQKQGNDIPAMEITAATPLDKTPANMQVLIDILKRYQSSGLDEAIISGYKIKNL